MGCFESTAQPTNDLRVSENTLPTEADHLFKVVILGDSGVGKSALILRYAEGTFTPGYTSTIGVDFKLKVLEIDGSRCKVQLWDTAGQERFRTVTNSLLRGAAAMIVTFDITNPETLANVDKWHEEIEKQGSARLVKWLVGNKCDLSNRQVSESEAKKVAQKYGMQYIETSAKTGANVDETFVAVTKAMLDVLKH